MIRDNQPIHNIGYGSTSRDMGDSDNVNEGVSPNSGYIARALEGHPMLKMATALVATGIGVHYASSFMKEGGLKLGMTLAQKAAQEDGSHLLKTGIQKFTRARAVLDRFEGVAVGARRAAGELVYEEGGKLTTGYSEKSLRAGYNLARETGTDWHFRNAVQQKLIKQVRRMPYEVPAFYAADKLIGRRLFGHGEPESKGRDPNTKWYNPSHHIVNFAKDITKTAAMQLGGFVLPTAVAGATKESSVNFFRTQLENIDNVIERGAAGYTKQQIALKGFSMKAMLQEVGHEAADIFDKAAKFSQRSSGALASGWTEYSKVDRNPVAQLYKQRHGVPGNAGDEALRPGSSRSTSDRLRSISDSIFRRGSNQPLDHDLAEHSLLDMIPGHKAVRQGASAARNQYRMISDSQKILQDVTKFNEIVNSGKYPTRGSVEQLSATVQELQSKANSPITRIGGFISDYGRNDVNSRGIVAGNKFKRIVEHDEYKKLLKTQLQRQGASESAADRFVRTLRITDDIQRHSLDPAFKDIGGLETVSPVNRFAMGEKPNTSDDFFGELISRFNKTKHGQAHSLSMESDALKTAIEHADGDFLGQRARQITERRIKDQWNQTYSNYVDVAGQTSLKPGKLVRSDFLDDSNILGLKRRAAAVLGSADIENESALDIVLARHGIDPAKGAHLRAFLVDNKQMNDTGMSGVLGFLGFNKVGAADYAKSERIKSKYFTSERIKRTEGSYEHEFNFMSNLPGSESKQFQNQLLNFERLTGQVSAKTGASSNLSSIYTNKNGKIINFSPLRGAAEGVSNFLTNNIKAPIVNFNPLNLMGLNEFAAQRAAGSVQIIGGMTNHPFLGAEAQGASSSLLSWHKTGGVIGSKGKVFKYGRNAEGRIASSALEGEFRPLSTRSESMFAKNAALAAGQGTVKPQHDESTFLGRLKRTLNYGEEQSGSVFQYAGRLLNRRFDVNNESVMAAVIKAKSGGTAAEAEAFSIGGFGRRKSLKLLQQDAGEGVNRYTLINANDESEIVASHSQLMEAFTGFANNTFSQGTHRDVSQALFDDQGVNSLTAAREVIAGGSGRYADQLAAAGNMQGITTGRTAKGVIRGLGEHLEGLKETNSEFYEPLAKAFSRLNKFSTLSEEGFAKTSQMFQHSPSTVTTMDEFTTELTRYLVQLDAVVSGNPAQTMANAAKIIDDLAESGAISAAQKAEAQTSISSTVFNLSAFTTYKQGDVLGGLSAELSAGGVQSNFANRFTEARNILSQHNNHGLLDPYTQGTVAMPRTNKFGAANRIMQKISPVVKKNFAPSKYQFGNTPSSLSSEADYTFVPTFKTALQKNPKQALLSAAGINTYGNEQGFSFASVPMSHGFGRLNRYFETVGAGVQESAYRGPISMFTNGLVGQRVLPAVAIGTAALTVDRTAGGLVNPKDDRGERVYSPLVIGGAARVAVEARSIMSGITPGGMNRKEKKDQLLKGETAVRQGRWWALGNTPFKGGKIQYFRPSWYRRMQAASTYTSESFGSPIEKAAYYTDFSPGRVIDPYRYERKHYEDRPYPLTGEYFSGPWGPLTPALNMTIGRVLKPQKVMHKEEVDAALASYVPAGEGGAYLPQQQKTYDYGNMPPNPAVSYTAAPPPNIPIKPLKNIPMEMPASIPQGISGSGAISRVNSSYSGAAGARYTASNSTRSQLGVINSNMAAASNSSSSVSRYTNATAIAPSYGNRISGAIIPPNPPSSSPAPYPALTYGPSVGSMKMPEKIVEAGLPIRSGSMQYQAGDLGYKLQETAGIYGFMGGQVRKSLGFGKYDFEPDRSVLQSASEGYGTTRAFWDLNLGGMGDLPLPSEGPLGNIEISEIVRRFIPHKRSGVNQLNPIKNTMGKKYQFLPGSDNFIDFTTGDPFTKVAEGEMRLPGVGYERLNKLYSDRNGRYGAVNQLDILADVAPYSKEYRNLDRRIDKIGLSEEERAKVGEIRAQRNAIEESKNSFTPYNPEKGSFKNKVFHPFSTAKESMLHTDNFINNKFTGRRTATEDWERKNVYGATFPEWQRPIDSFVKPIYNKGTQRNPIVAGAIGAFALRQFVKGPGPKAAATVIGAATVGGYSLLKNMSGRRSIPMQRKKELALEEYTDILTYVKDRTAASRAMQAGDVESAKQYMAASKKTMYGTDLDSTSIDRLAAGIPKRKRNHFKAMLQAPPGERKRILSTAGRLERRIYEAAWGMPVERKPDLTEYFQTHELPGKNWEGWHPNTNMEHVKIKMGQSMGLEMSQMGYYPQQIKEANLTNPSYPVFGNGKKMGSKNQVREQLQNLMYSNGINGKIVPSRTYSGSGGVNITAGVR